MEAKNLMPGTNLQVLDLPMTSAVEREAHAALLLDMHIRKVAASLVDVPTLPHQVRDALRQYGEPVRLFGENNANVRDRLRLIMAKVEVLKGTMKEDSSLLSGGDSGGILLSQQHQQQQQQLGEYAPFYKDQKLKKDVAIGREDTTAVTKYSHATDELIAARGFISQYSVERAQRRLTLEKRRRYGAKKRTRLSREGMDYELQSNRFPSSRMVDRDFYDYHANADAEDIVQVLNHMDKECQMLYKDMRNLALEGSQYGDNRPLSSLCTSYEANALSMDDGRNTRSYSNFIATGGWSGSIKVWDGNSSALDLLLTKETAHEDRIMGIAMQPFDAGISSESNENESTSMIATASIDLTGKLWKVRRTRYDVDTTDRVTPSLRMEQVAHLIGHQRRLCKVAFHPSGKYVGTTSFDHTWRLWDVETGGKELLLQDGHWKEVFGIGFHPDGSLISTTDFGSVVQVWDLRTGKSACHFLGHAMRVLCTQFSPNGFQMATAGDDGTIKIWDLRQRKQYASIPAHSRLITQLRFAHDHDGQHGEYLTSCSFDGTGKIWSTRDWKLLNTMRGHDGKVMGIDILSGRRSGIITCGYDKTLKIWR